MYRIVRILLLVAVAFLPAACATQHVRAIDTLKRSDTPPRILMMPPDVELAELSLGGISEVNAQWTLGARDHLSAAMRDHLTHIRASFSEYGQPADDDEAQALDQLQKVHGLVGQTIQLFGPFADQVVQLPSKGGRFDWSLGPETARLTRQAGADYLLFVYVRDTYASAGRQVAKLFMAGMFGLHLQGGVQMGYASLVDAKTGQVVWFNRLYRESGDLRQLAPARESVGQLLDGIPK